MIFKTPAVRLSFILTLLTVNLLFIANMIGIVPDASQTALESRKALSESLALQFSAAASKGEFQSIQNTLQAVVERNDSMRSAAIRTHKGNLVALTGKHLENWKPPPGGKSTPTHVYVPIFMNGRAWATVEIRFAPLWANDLARGFSNSFVGLLAFLALGGYLCYYFVIKRTLRTLDPSAVIPDRVQKAFDALQEGVLILDRKEHIVMANESFARLFNKSSAEMVGLKGSELGWLDCQGPEQVSELPWFRVLAEGEETKSASLRLANSHGRKIKLAVNAAVVTDTAGKSRGTLVTFDDISRLEETNFELNHMVEKLQVAHDEIKVKSKELESLAKFDPLTLLLNRRSLAIQFNVLFTKAKVKQRPLSCLMMDIDFFKSVNDRYGHATGDKVIKGIADVLKTHTRDNDLVGRYGGEEFCVVLPNLNPEKAAQVAERIRGAVEKNSISGISITVSLGVSSLKLNTNNPDELINLADKALYAAKEGGRNRVVSWGKDMLSSARSDGDMKNKGRNAEMHTSAAAKADPEQLKRRVKDLEGLLKERTLQLEHYEMYDVHTGLPTRSLFEDRISHEIARAERKNHLAAILSMNIGTIKRVDETLGHGAAQELLNACGQRLNEVLRENIDTVAMINQSKGISTVSLISQTEFGILLTDIQKVDHVTWVMKRLLDAFEKAFMITEKEIFTTVHFGVSIFPHDGKSVETLIVRASNACRYAKHDSGNSRYLFSSNRLNEEAARQLEIENSLHNAIKNDEFQLHYQPKIDAATSQLVGFEALIRWNSERLGFVPPDKFIPVAERSGLIGGIGEWVIHTACQQLRMWMDAGYEVWPIAVNMSAIQLRQSNLTSRIQYILDEFHIDSQLLEIELTESAMVDAQDEFLSVLNRIKEMGLRLTMDDFGTGYSSLAYLRNLPLASLKIDRSFIADIHKDENAEKLIETIISLAHGMKLEVVAEGIEEKFQADYMIALGCEYLQGYYFSRPVPQHEAQTMLQKQLGAVAG